MRPITYQKEWPGRALGQWVSDLVVLKAVQSKFEIDGGSGFEGGADASDANGGAPGSRKRICGFLWRRLKNGTGRSLVWEADQKFM